MTAPLRAPLPPPAILPMTAPAAAGATIFSTSFSLVAGAVREIVPVLIREVPSPGVSSCVKRNATCPRPLTFPGRCAEVMCPLITAPAGITSTPWDVTARRMRPSTRCSTRLMSDPTAVWRSTGNTVPAGSVTSRYSGPPPSTFFNGLADAASVPAGAAVPLAATAADLLASGEAAKLLAADTLGSLLQAADSATTAEIVISRFMTSFSSTFGGCKWTATGSWTVFPAFRVFPRPVRLKIVATLSETDIQSPAPTLGERVLIVEDDPATRVGLSELVNAWGFQTDEAVNGEEALQKVTSFRPAIIVSDLVMPRMGGLELLRSLKDQLSDITLILLTAQGTVESAVEAIKEGAYDYLSKPVDPSRLRILLQKAVERQETLREVKQLRRQLREQGSFGRIIGNSPSIRSVYRVVEQAAPTSASVLIWGESGTGKELVAQTIHELSSRGQMPFVPINCAAIPETLLESEIFGHEKGSFTGAVDRRAGCFELADRGTLFLDEIAEMVPVTQVKLLRVLQERRFRRLGGRVEQEVDVRVIAATNVNPLDAIRDGKLRDDLFYRLNVFTIELPPLRDRKDDLGLLVQAFIEEFNARDRRNIVAVSQDAMRILEGYHWPGNVRELRNVIERATILADGEFIELRHLPPALVDTPASGQPALALSPGTTVEEAESRLILMTLEHTRDNKTRAAEILGISLKTLHNKLNKLRGRVPGRTK